VINKEMGLNISTQTTPQEREFYTDDADSPILPLLSFPDTNMTFVFGWGFPHGRYPKFYLDSPIFVLSLTTKLPLSRGVKTALYTFILEGYRYNEKPADLVVKVKRAVTVDVQRVIDTLIGTFFFGELVKTLASKAEMYHAKIGKYNQILLVSDTDTLNNTVASKVELISDQKLTVVTYNTRTIHTSHGLVTFGRETSNDESSNNKMNQGIDPEGPMAVFDSYVEHIYGKVKTIAMYLDPATSLLNVTDGTVRVEVHSGTAVDAYLALDMFLDEVDELPARGKEWHVVYDYELEWKYILVALMMKHRKRDTLNVNRLAGMTLSKRNVKQMTDERTSRVKIQDYIQPDEIKRIADFLVPKGQIDELQMNIKLITLPKRQSSVSGADWRST
jgi:hypothetical protein